MYARRRSSHGGISSCLNPMIWVGAFVIGVGLSCLVLVGLWATRKPSAAPAQSTAILNVIRAPTATPIVVTPTLVASPTDSALPPGPPSGTIQIGAYVQINGTGGNGLRLRAEPGLNSPVRLVGSEAEVFRVDDGPREIDGYSWWYLVGPFDETRYGWAVANFLAVVQNP